MHQTYPLTDHVLERIIYFQTSVETIFKPIHPEVVDVSKLQVPSCDETKPSSILGCDLY